MNTMRKLFLFTATLCGVLFNTLAQADEAAIARVDAEVEQRALALDQKYGIWVDYTDRINIRLELIAKKSVVASDGTETAQQLTDRAIATYQIIDSNQQRQLLMKIDGIVSNSTGGGGTPPCNVNPANCEG